MHSTGQAKEEGDGCFRGEWFKSPNAQSEAAVRWLAKGQENVNADHVAWHSPMTLSTLLERTGYARASLYYYGGSDPMAEGLIVVTE